MVTDVVQLEKNDIEQKGKETVNFKLYNYGKISAFEKLLLFYFKIQRKTNE